MNGQKLLVLSDTHGNSPFLEAVLRWACGDTFDAAIFLGDGIEDLRRAAALTGFFGEWKIVRGNNDYAISVPEAAVIECGGHRFFLCHGHRYALYNGNDRLIAAARKMEADTALFGHIHVPSLENEDGLVLINPGSIGRPRSTIGSTFAVIDCPPGKPLNVRFWKIDPPGTIVELTRR
ncbi:MAG: metallophosphoesterase [Treponema sp.]|jgi:putative phosphoesterase|nr:metallophosphoesterase [Treponema sp.]